MTDEENIEFAFCWYESDEWEQLKRTAADSDTLDDSYEEWKSNANRAINDIRAQGHIVAKISIKIDDLIAWCKENNSDNNSEARSSYAAIKLRERRRDT